MKRLSPAQRRALENGVKYGDLAYGIYGQSAHGGFDQTWKALLRRGLIDRDGNVTDAGRAAIGKDGGGAHG